MHARRPTGHGGWRPGAGRKKRPGSDPHLPRARFAGATPVYVTVKLAADAPTLRTAAVARAVWAAIEAGHCADFRVVHYGVFGDQLRFVVEASGTQALTRGMQGLSIRLARAINAQLGRRGKLFAQRYQARPLRTAAAVRDAIRDVLLGARRPISAGGARLKPGAIDPHSSGLWFDGWKAAARTDVAWLRALAKAGRPTAAPRTALLARGWRTAGGPLDVDDAPRS
ncbi:MAG: hypothetical protein JNK64_17545 [Myxococcales bacterium]|nr:hypothetical protein [Myxococcales bacterium]